MVAGGALLLLLLIIQVLAIDLLNETDNLEALRIIQSQFASFRNSPTVVVLNNPNTSYFPEQINIEDGLEKFDILNETTLPPSVLNAFTESNADFNRSLINETLSPNLTETIPEKEHFRVDYSQCDDIEFDCLYGTCPYNQSRELVPFYTLPDNVEVCAILVFEYDKEIRLELEAKQSNPISANIDELEILFVPEAQTVTCRVHCWVKVFVQKKPEENNGKYYVFGRVIEGATQSSNVPTRARGRPFSERKVGASVLDRRNSFIDDPTTGVIPLAKQKSPSNKKEEKGFDLINLLYIGLALLVVIIIAIIAFVQIKQHLANKKHERIQMKMNNSLLNSVEKRPLMSKSQPQSKAKSLGKHLPPPPPPPPVAASPAKGGTTDTVSGSMESVTVPEL